MVDRVSLRTRHVFVPIVAVMMFVVGACSGQPPFETTNVAPFDSIVAMPDESVRTVHGVIAWSESLSAVVGKVRGKCLTDQGFPQFQKSLETRRPAEGSYTMEPLNVSIIDFGPSTVEEARKYGFVGTSLAFDEGDHGVLISRDPKFDRASIACEEWIYQRLAPELAYLQTKAASFHDDVQGAYVGGVSKMIKPMLINRFRCLREHGYALTDPESLVEADSMEDIVRTVGVDIGTSIPAAGPTPSESRVKSGSVRVFPPVAPAGYEPSKEEVSLALAYVSCGQSMGFNEEVKRASRTARTKAEMDFRAQALPLGAALEKVVRDIRTGTSS